MSEIETMRPSFSSWISAMRHLVPKVFSRREVELLTSNGLQRSPMEMIMAPLVRPLRWERDYQKEK